jgi:hypothetical protein
VTVVHHRTPTAPDQNTHEAPTPVYRYYDRVGRLIYVGITARGMTRQREHDKSAEWWPYVARQEVDHHPTRADALRAERELIGAHHPPFNKQHNPDHPRLRTEYLQCNPNSNRVTTTAELAASLDHLVPLTLLGGDEGIFTCRVRPEYRAITDGWFIPPDTLVIDQAGERAGVLYGPYGTRGLLLDIRLDDFRSGLQVARPTALVQPGTMGGRECYRVAYVQAFVYLPNADAGRR